MIFRLERYGMKFGHIGDLHIGKRVHDFSMLEDQRYILDQMMKIFAEQKVDRKSTRLNSSHNLRSRMPSSA